LQELRNSHAAELAALQDKATAAEYSLQELRERQAATAASPSASRLEFAARTAELESLEATTRFRIVFDEQDARLVVARTGSLPSKAEQAMRRCGLGECSLWVPRGPGVKWGSAKTPGSSCDGFSLLETAVHGVTARVAALARRRAERPGVEVR